MKKIIIVVILMLIVIIVKALIFNKKMLTLTSNNTIKIGAPLEFSGGAAKYGENAKKGIDLAIKEYNLNHNPKVEVIYEDNHTSAKDVISSYKKLISLNKVIAIIGPLFQTQAGALLPIIKSDNTPTVMISPVPLESRNSDTNPITVWMDPSEEAGKMAEYVFSLGLRRVAVIGTQDSWELEVSNAFENKFTSLGGIITNKQIMLPDERDTRSVITKILNTKPEAIFIGTYLQFIPVVKNLNEFGFKGKKYGIEVDAYLAGETKPISNGIQFISPDFYTDEFAEKFKSEFNEIPTIPAGQAYDATNILLSFIEETKNKDEILKKMKEFKTFDGVTGKMEINDKNRVIFPVTIFEIKDGDFVKIKHS